ncbi:MAG: ComF family protein [Deltaproteobacteria bacterium]|nr:ComF family protein [Deltaproteobacteria bacterium]
MPKRSFNGCDRQFDVMSPNISHASSRVFARLRDAFRDALFPLTCLMCGKFYLRRSGWENFNKRGVSFNETTRVPPSTALFARRMAPYVCPACSQQFTPIESPCCTCCGVMFKSRQGTDHLCGGCLESKRYFGMARAVGVYDQALMAVIHGFKYGEKAGLAAPLSLLLLNTYGHFWHDSPMDVVVPVPLHGRRLRKRGFNQVYLAIRRWKDPTWQKSFPRPLEVQKSVLRRIRSTPPQTGMGRSERLQNVKGAFELAAFHTIRKKNILLVDDVYTTGATVNECAKILLKGGANAVDVLTLARAM